MKFKNPLAVEDLERDGCSELDRAGARSDIVELLRPVMVLAEPR